VLLHILWGMLIGYLIASFEIAILIYKKGYLSFNEIPDKDARV